MAHPKHDYDSQAFYDLLFKYASVIQYDNEIAALLDLDYETFSRMKNGNYIGWTAEQNEERSERILQVLARARGNTLLQVKNTLLRLGVGAVKVKSRSIKKAVTHCQCRGKDPKCPECNGTGYVEVEDAFVMQESEQEISPNMQALMVWLRHHDPNYRKVERGEDLSDDNTIEVQKGVNIMSWLKKEMEDTALSMASQPIVAEKPHIDE